MTYVFWVSSLAYPNSLGTKGYIVVVVVADPAKGMVAHKKKWSHYYRNVYGGICVKVTGHE